MSLDTERLMACWPSLVGVMRNRLPRHDPAVWEDMAGDVIERALRYQDQFDGSDDTLIRWLMTIARNLTIDYVRRHINRAENALPLQDYGHATLDAGSDRHLTQIAVHDALAEADEYSRRILTARYLEGRRMIDVLPHLPKSSASRNYTRALASLRRVLESVA